MKIYRIEIDSRGTYRDESGNPYCAYKMRVYLSYCSYANQVNICKIGYYDSDISSAYILAMAGLKEVLGIDIYDVPKEVPVTHTHKMCNSYHSLVQWAEKNFK